MPHRIRVIGRRLCAAPLVLLLASAALGESRIVEHNVSVSFAPDGSVLQTTEVRVLVGTDPVAWTPLRLTLRDHETLEEFSAMAYDGARAGRRVKGARHRSTVSIAEGTQHSVLTTHWFELPALARNAIVALTYSVRSDSAFPQGAVEIPLDDPCRSVRIEIADPPPGFRYRLAQGTKASVGERQDGLVVTRPDPCATGVSRQPRAPLTLHFAWGDARSWSELGGLYDDLLARAPMASTVIEERARAILAGSLDAARHRVDLLLDFVRRDIRSIAVELGEGWYLPAPPSTVLARGWGDCKDKALLLSRLLETAGVEAYPALIDSGTSTSFDPAFPRLSAFDHVIVAVAERSLDGGRDERWLFLDPTLPPSDGRALDPRLVGRYVLVVRGSGRSSLERVGGRGASDAVESARGDARPLRLYSKSP